MKSKFIIIALGTSGDIHPFIDIASSLLQHGNEVVLLANDHFEGLIEQQGIEFYSLGSEAEYNSMLNDPNLWDSEKGFEVYWNTIEHTTRKIYYYLERIVKSSNCVVISHQFAIAGARILKDKCPEMKLICVYLAPAGIRTYIKPFQIGPLKIPSWMPKSINRRILRSIDKHIINPVAVPKINSFREEINLKPIRHLTDFFQTGADLSLALFPTWYAEYQQDWPKPLLAGEFLFFDNAGATNLPADIQRFIEAGTAPVVFTPGTGMRHAANFFQIAVAAVQRVGARAIFLTPHNQQLPKELPDTIIACDYLPFGALLPHISCLVHHGGIGTCAQAMKAGVPQIIVPSAHDQFDNGQRIASLGIGFCIKQAKYSAPILSKRLQFLLTANNSCLEKCRQISSRFVPEPQERVYQKIASGLNLNIESLPPAGNFLTKI